MTKTPIDELLPNLPKRAPVWSIGVTTIIVAIVTSVITIYLVSKEDIRQVVGWAESHHEEITKAKIVEEGVVIDNIMKLLSVKSQQILELSKAVATTQQNNFTLMQRIDRLEKDVLDFKAALTICEKELKACRDKK